MTGTHSPPSSTGLGPPWLALAWAEFGQTERNGEGANPRILSYYRDSGHAGIASDEVAWCAAFAGAILARAGHRPTGSLLARSYLNWGQPLIEPRYGAIAVFSRGADPGAGHVGFLLGQTNDKLVILGGNQSDAVTVELIPRTRLLGLRWPLAPLTQGSHTIPSQSASPAPPAIPGPARHRSASALDHPNFIDALAHVLDQEGGYTDDPEDPGGPTNRGLTLADLARNRGIALTDATRAPLLRDLRTISDYELREIYHRDYWLDAACHQLPTSLSAFHFDTAVNMGTGTAIRMLQTALAVTIDGEVGPETLKAARSAAIPVLLGDYADLRRRRYRSLSGFPRFGRGWLARVDRTLTFSLKLANRKGTSSMSDTNVTAHPSEAKWWGNSTTIWGAVITGLAAILPAIGPAVGLEIPREAVTSSADQIGAIVQAATGLAGTMLAIFGRIKATRPVGFKEFKVRL